MASPLISIAEAREHVRKAVHAPLGTEPVDIDLALDRFLAQDVVAAHDAPPFPCSAMDGYALAEAGGPSTFRIVGESRAGAPFAGSLASGEAIRISTGAMVPPDARAIVRQEDVTVSGDQAECTVAVPDGENVRWAGEDMHAGETILAAGTRIGPSELAVAVAAGHGGVLTVARCPIVSIISTGDELRAPAEPLAPGTVHNSNAPMLRAFAQRAGATVGPSRLVPDDARATEDALERALADCDVLLITGGVSVGPHDHVKPALARLGVQQRFWGVALQPGKPTWFGVREHRLVFGLPGNPVSAAVTFTLFARPAIAALLGAGPSRWPLSTATLAGPINRSRARERAVRVRLHQEGDRLLATPTGPQDSHLITSLSAADALGFVPRGDGRMEAGEPITLEPLLG